MTLVVGLKGSRSVAIEPALRDEPARAQLLEGMLDFLVAGLRAP